MSDGIQTFPLEGLLRMIQGTLNVFAIGLVLGIPVLIDAPFCNYFDHSVPPVLALLTPRNHGSSLYLSRFPFLVL
jgi:hypothetical protein